MIGEQVLIFDTTLRDGEQCPGASMQAEEKITIARALDEMRVDVIEAGFPASSRGDFLSVEQISAVVQNARVCALSRANRNDIGIANDALGRARHKRIHTFISTSPLHMKYKLQMSPDAVLEAVTESVTYARNLCDDVEWSCEDGTRSDPEFLYRCFEAAIKAGATTVNIADTVGYTMPNEFANLIRSIRGKVPGMDKVRFSVHCHDDLGLATANSLAAIEAGARQVECTINSLGERAGNASLEEIVMSIHTRSDFLKVHSRVRTEMLTPLSHLVSETTGFSVPPNKAVVGANAFAHESGIHQHGVLRNRTTYEIMDPSVVGASGSQIVMGKHSGRHALRAKLEAMDIELGENALQDLFERFKHLADTKKTVTDDEIRALATTDHRAQLDRLHLASLSLSAQDGGKCEVSLVVDGRGAVRKGSGVADAALDAVVKALKQAVPHEFKLGYVRSKSISTNSASTTTVVLRLDAQNGQHIVVENSASDPNVAFAKAYLDALANLTAHG